MMEIINYIVKLTIRCPELPLFKFQMNREAAESNFHVLWLRRFNFNLEKAIEAQAKLPMGYRSEFQKCEVLLTLLQHHPLWNQMREMLVQGLQWPIELITNVDRVANLEALNIGNYKGATTQLELLLKLVSGDIKYGYALPLPLGKIKRIPGICMAPLNIQAQWTRNEDGGIIKKDRLTHDQTPG